MKKIIFSFCFLMIFCVSNAQKIEVSTSYGMSSLYGVSDDILSAIVGIMTDESLKSSSGVLNVSAARYNESERWRYGIDLSHEFFNTSNTSFSKYSFTTISPKVDYFWSKSDKSFRFYSGASIGVLFRNAEYINSEAQKVSGNDTAFGFNVTPIGLRYGGDFAGFIEHNWGTKGFLQAGIAYTF